MIVTLNGTRLNEAFPAGVSLRGVIDKVRSEIADDRLIVGVSVDGRACDEAELDQRLDAPLATDAQVDLEAGSCRAIVGDALRAAREALTDAEQMRSEATAALHAGRTAEGVARLGEFARLWQGAVDTMINGGRLVGEDWTQREHDGLPVSELMGDFHGALTSLRDALEAHDMVGLADILHYEFPPLATKWGTLLGTLAAEQGASRG